MVKASKRPRPKVPKPSQQSTEQRMLRAQRDELRRSQRLAADVSRCARQLRAAMRRADYNLSELRDYLLALLPKQGSLVGDAHEVSE